MLSGRELDAASATANLEIADVAFLSSIAMFRSHAGLLALARRASTASLPQSLFAPTTVTKRVSALKAQYDELGLSCVVVVFVSSPPTTSLDAGYVVVPNLISQEFVGTLLEEMRSICRGQRGVIPGLLSQ